MNLPKKLSFSFLLLGLGIFHMQAQESALREFQKKISSCAWISGAPDKTLMYDGIHVIQLSPSTNQIYIVSIVNEFVGECKVQYTHPYFEVELGTENAIRFARYIYGQIIDDNHINFTSDDERHALTDTTFKNTRWFLFSKTENMYSFKK